MPITPLYNSPELPGKKYFNIYPEYQNDKKLYDNFLTEAYNLFGVPCNYYVTTWNTSADRIFGEDNDRKFTRSFEVYTYYDLPKEEELWSKFGIEGLDNFWMYCSKKHFSVASTCDISGTTGTYAEYTPKAGDIIYSKYTQKFYEILTVKDAEGIFLQQKHSWYFICKPYIMEHIKLTSATSATEISAYTNMGASGSDILDLKATVESEISAVEYNPPDTEESATAHDPFNSW
jgi:hypothetical protein